MDTPKVQSPADFIIYKGGAAFQVSLKPGTPIIIDSNKSKDPYLGTNKGCIFVVGANSLGERKYDWKNKVTMALSEHEVAKVMDGLKGNNQKFYHDPDKGRANEGQRAKTMNIDFANGKLFIHMSEKVRGEVNKIKAIPIEKEEASGLHTLLQTAIPRILGWA